MTGGAQNDRGGSGRGDVAGYRVRRGSRASRRPSPMKLIERTARKIIRPGKRARVGEIVRKFCASNSRRPQVGVSGGKPRPRNERVDSASIEAPTESVPATMIGLRVFGK